MCSEDRPSPRPRLPVGDTIILTLLIYEGDKYCAAVWSLGLGPSLQIDYEESTQKPLGSFPTVFIF